MRFMISQADLGGEGPGTFPDPPVARGGYMRASKEDIITGVPPAAAGNRKRKIGIKIRMHVYSEKWLADMAGGLTLIIIA